MTGNDYEWAREEEINRLAEENARLSSQLAGMREALTPLPCCASCGAVTEMTIKWEEEDVLFLRHASNIHDLVTVKARVPVWTCNVCEQSYTDAHAENIRQQVIDAARAALSVVQAPTKTK